jgi:hypothetical protein
MEIKQGHWWKQPAGPVKFLRHKVIGVIEDADTHEVEVATVTSFSMDPILSWFGSEAAFREGFVFDAVK